MTSVGDVNEGRRQVHFEYNGQERSIFVDDLEFAKVILFLKQVSRDTQLLVSIKRYYWSSESSLVGTKQQGVKTQWQDLKITRTFTSRANESAQKQTIEIRHSTEHQ